MRVNCIIIELNEEWIHNFVFESVTNDLLTSQEGQREGDAIRELQRRLEMSGLTSNSLQIVDEMEDKELILQGLRVCRKEAVNNMQVFQISHFS